MKKHVLLGALLLGASTAMAGPVFAKPVVVAQPADIRSTNPGVNRDNTTDGVVLNVLEGLVGYRANGSVAPLLAESIQVSDDGLTYTFKLRKNVKFHNGADLTSEDVLWSWGRYMDPKTGWRCLPEFDGRSGLKVTEVSAPDAYTVVMKTNYASTVFLDTLARTDCAMAAVIHKDSVNADGSWKQPIGTGPYKLGEWKRGQYIMMTAFDQYASPPGDKPDGYVGKKSPLAKEVKFLVVPDSSTAKAGLQSGAIDVAQITYADYEALSKVSDVEIQMPQEASKHALLFQTRDPVLKNKKLRQAIAASLDIEQIVLAATEGLSKDINNGAIHSGSAYYGDVERSKGYKYDPAKAQQLLKESGYKGEKIVIYANKRAHVPSYQVAVMAQAMMQSIGINAQIEVLEWATQLDRYNTGNYQMSSFSYSSRLDPALSYEQFSGDKDKQPRKVWETPDALAKISASLTEFDEAKRQKIFDELHGMLLDDTPLIILFNGTTAWGVRKDVKGFTAWEGKPLMW